MITFKTLGSRLRAPVVKTVLGVALAAALSGIGCRTVAAQGDASPVAATSGSDLATVRSGRLVRLVRATGQTMAAHSFTVRVPRFRHSGGDLTLTYIIANGASVRKGDVLVRFDETVELQNEQDALAKY